MKFTKFYYPAHRAVLDGVTLTAAENREAQTMALVLQQLDRHALGAMLDGLAREAAFMSDIQEWTREDSEEEAFRTKRKRIALITHHAVQMAMARLD